MCQVCGCQQYIKEGQGSIRRRVTDIVKELRVTPNNVDDYEFIESIAGMIAPFGTQEDEMYQTAVWISDLHKGNRAFDPEKRYQAHIQAFKDIFARLPVDGAPKHLATTWHQLEQLARELDEKALASLDTEMQKTVQAVNHVHDDRTRETRLKERYGL